MRTYRKAKRHRNRKTRKRGGENNWSTITTRPRESRSSEIPLPKLSKANKQISKRINEELAAKAAKAAKAAQNAEYAHNSGMLLKGLVNRIIKQEQQAQRQAQQQAQQQAQRQAQQESIINQQRKDDLINLVRRQSPAIASEYQR